MTSKNELQIKPATRLDVPLILAMIKALAEYEKLSDDVTATEALLEEHLFGPQPSAEVLIGYYHGEPVAFALFFTNFSTFVGKPGLYLEDLFVKTEHRGKGFGKDLLVYLSKVALARDYGRFEWSVLDWNEPSIQFYLGLGAVPMNEWTVYRLSKSKFELLAKNG